MSVCVFNSLLNGKYSNLSNAAALPSKSFSGKKSSPIKNLYLLMFPDDKSKILAICLSKLYWTLFCSILLLIVYIFFTNTHFYNNFFLNRNRLSDDKVVSFTKNQDGSLVYFL